MKKKVSGMKYFLGIDVGGTNIKAVLLNEKNTVIRSFKAPTQARKGKAKIIRNIETAALLLSVGKNISGIGIAIAGKQNKNHSTLLASPNIKCLAHAQLKKILSKKLKAKIVLENDAKAAAFAESKLGAGKHAKRLVLLTLGTGIGAGVVINEKLIPEATEFGHIVIDPKGYKCGCGKRGCLEAMANARFLELTARKLAKENKKKLKAFDPVSLQCEAECGNKIAIETYNQMAENLAVGIAIICKKVNPEIVVLAGGLSKAPMIFAPATKKLKELLGKKSPKIVKSKIGYFAGAIGAALLTMKKN